MDDGVAAGARRCTGRRGRARVRLEPVVGEVVRRVGGRTGTGEVELDVRARDGGGAGTCRRGGEGHRVDLDRHHVRRREPTVIGDGQTQVVRARAAGLRRHERGGSRRRRRDLKVGVGQVVGARVRNEVTVDVNLLPEVRDGERNVGISCRTADGDRRVGGATRLVDAGIRRGRPVGDGDLHDVGGAGLAELIAHDEREVQRGRNCAHVRGGEGRVGDRRVRQRHEVRVRRRQGVAVLIHLLPAVGADRVSIGVGA